MDTEIIYTILTVLKWGIELFSALSYLEQMKKLHRDIKPAKFVTIKKIVILRRIAKALVVKMTHYGE